MKHTQKIREILEQNWNEAGYTAPNTETYPYQWLWDSCFHSLIWAKLGEPEKALQELANIFQFQTEDGFVPHINYFPDVANSKWKKIWGRKQSSCITQPPMFGHTIAELTKMDIPVPEKILNQAHLSFNFLLKSRKRDAETGLIYICHPWETGIDNSPRWDDFVEGDFEVASWNTKKLELLNNIEFTQSASPKFNPAFPVLSIGFNALVAFNILELEKIVGATQLSAEAQEIVQALDAQFNESSLTFCDVNKDKTSTHSGQVKVLDALLVGLVSEKNLDFIEAQILDDAAFDGSFGPPSVHRGESVFEANTYWRGSAWPQMTYLFWQMFMKTKPQTAQILGQNLKEGVQASNFSEHWNADTGESLGACPQSWTGLALLV